MKIQVGRLPAVVVAFQLLCLLFAASSSIRAAEDSTRIPEQKQYGEPGPNKILVVIEGQVTLPGRYCIERGMTLSELSKLAGGFEECPDCKSLPTMVTLSSRIDPSRKKKYGFADLKTLDSVALNEGDCVVFWHFRL